MCGYLYRSEEEMAENHESDQRELTMWLEKAARGGHWGAIDNLLVLGVGEETERLRKLYKENIELFEKAPPPVRRAGARGWPQSLEGISNHEKIKKRERAGKKGDCRRNEIWREKRCC